MSITTLARNPLELLEDNFARPAGLTGRLVGRLMARQHRTLTAWAVAQLDVRRTDRVVDIGCGGGTALGRLAQAAPDGLVAGVDYSPEMVAQAARRHARAVRRGLVTVHRGDAMALPFADGTFDRACAIETLYFWPDPHRGLTEAARVLRPGGRLLVAVEMSREASGRTLRQRLLGRRFTARSARHGLRILSGADLVDLLRAAGFVDVTVASEPDRSFGWLAAVGHTPAATGGVRR